MCIFDPAAYRAGLRWSGAGSESGAVDVFDLERAEHVAAVEVGKQAGGIAFWKTTDEGS